MTNDVLQSDIDLARKLLDASRPSDEIVTALGYRGIDGSRATQLLADLQAGKTVEPDRPIAINLPPRTIEETAPFGQKPTRTNARTDLTDERHDSRSTGRKANPFPWFTIIGLVSAAVCIGVFVLLSRKSHSVDKGPSQASDKSIIESGTSKHQAAGRGLDAKAISVQVEPEGLRLCGNPVARENFLPTIFKVLGASARTNQVEKADQVIYAYDAGGVLVYAPKNGGHYSIVLDFDASGGAAGTKSPFVGTFKIRDETVRPNTDAAALGAIKELGLQAPKSASGIFHAQYGTVELVFGYLKTPERLSLIEIDFK